MSELDWCLCTPEVLSAVSGLEIDKCNSYPSNHAPLSIQINVTDNPSLDSVLRAAEELLTHACEVNLARDKPICKKPIRVISQDRSHVEKLLNELPLPHIDQGDINQTTRQVTDALYTLLSPVIHQYKYSTSDSQCETYENRWSKLIKENDFKGIWNAIN